MFSGRDKISFPFQIMTDADFVSEAFNRCFGGQSSHWKPNSPTDVTRLRVVTAVFHRDYSEHATPARSSCARARLALSLGTAAPRLQPLRWTSIWQPSLSPENGVGRPARGMLPEYLIALRGIETACKMEWRHRMADCPKFWLQFVSRFRSR